MQNQATIKNNILKTGKIHFPLLGETNGEKAISYDVVASLGKKEGSNNKIKTNRKYVCINFTYA